MPNRELNFLFLFLVVAVLQLQEIPSSAQTVTQISAGADFSLVLQSDGSLWATGRNSEGQLGNGTFTFATNRAERIVLAGVSKIAAGTFHGMFLKADGGLWVTGYNNYGGLGNGTYANTNRYEQVVSSNVITMTGGYGHTLFIKTDGSLWGIGRNGEGELGNGTYNFDSNRPVEILSSNALAVAAGQQHSLFVKTDGSLWSMGWNGFGQLGDGTYTQTNRPVAIVFSNVTAVAAGLDHSLFLKNDGSLWAMGRNNYGQLGNGTYAQANRPVQIVFSNVTAVAAGIYHSLFLRSDGSLWAMGQNLYGQLGNGYTNNLNIPQQIVSSNVTAIAAGAHTLFLQSDGSLWGMGKNDRGQLGDNTFVSTNQPKQLFPAAPSITCQPQSQTNYAGATLTLRASAWSAPLPCFQWQKNVTNLMNGDRVSGANADALTIANLSDSDAGIYSVIVSNSFGSLASSNASLTINNLPFIATQPLSQTVGIGSNVTFSAQAYGAPPFVFQWYFGNSPISSPSTGTNFSLYSVTNAQPNQSGDYSVRVFNGYGSATSSTAILTVVAYPPTILVQPLDQGPLAGRSANFTVAAAGTSPLHYQWLFNNTNIPGATNLNYIISATVTTDTGLYSVVVTNSAGSVTSSNAQLQVIVPPALGLRILAGYPVLGLSGMLNSNYSIQYKTQIGSPFWSNLLSISNLTSVPYQFLDPAGSVPPARYYRAVMQ